MSSRAEARRWWRRVDLRLAVFVGACAAALNAVLVSGLTAFAVFEAFEEQDRVLQDSAQRIADRWPADATAGAAAEGAVWTRVIEEGAGAAEAVAESVHGSLHHTVSLRTALTSQPGDSLVRRLESRSGARLEVLLPLRGFAEERRELLVGAAAVVALGSLASIGFGVLAARRALAPVRAMASAMQSIAPGSLGERLAERGSGDDLDALAGTINALLARLEWAFGRLSRFSADVAHELRNGINRLLNETEVVLLEGKEAGAAAAIASVHATAHEMRDLVERLLLLASGEEGRLALADERVELDALCARMVEFYRPVAEDLGVALRVRGPAADMRGDRLLLETAVSNLIENALRHGAGGAVIEVVIEADVDEVRLGVLDAGPGIPIADRERIFDRFVRLADGSGAGLGLPLARMIARVHGGELSAAPSPLGGAGFWLTLPLHQGPTVSRVGDG